MSMKESLDRMAKAHEAGGRDREKEHRAKLAREFRPDTRMEQLLRLRGREPHIYDRMGAEIRMAVGMYEQGRTAAGYEPEGDTAA